MKNMKKMISVLLCVAMMFTFLTLISSAADVTAMEDSSEKILDIIKQLLANANWGQILGILVQSLAKIGQIFAGLIG